MHLTCSPLFPISGRADLKTLRLRRAASRMK